MLQRVAADRHGRTGKADLRLTIESAYCPDKPSIQRKRPNAIRFTVLAHKVFTRSPVRFAAR
jgi:hypothetical protein